MYLAVFSPCHSACLVMRLVEGNNTHPPCQAGDLRAAISTTLEDPLQGPCIQRGQGQDERIFLSPVVLRPFSMFQEVITCSCAFDPPTTIGGRYYYYPHFIAWFREVRSSVQCPTKGRAEFKFRQAGPPGHAPLDHTAGL